MSKIFSILIVVFLIGLIVFIHELGHFIAAKKSGLEVDEFAIGFGPTLWKKEKNNTTYSIKLILLGGFVSIPFEKDGKRKSMNDIPFLRKIYVCINGVFFNIISAIIVTILFFVINGTPTEEIVVSNVISESNLYGKLEKNDRIISINNHMIKSTDDISKSLNDFNTIIIRRNNVEHSYEFKKILVDGKKIAGIATSAKETHNIIKAITYSFEYDFKITYETVKSIANMIIGKDLQNASGVIAVVGVTESVISKTQDVKYIFLFVLNFFVMISLSIAIFNLIPLPVLDGGKILIYTIEKLLGRKIKQKTIDLVNNISFAILLVMFFAIIIKDLLSYNFYKNL